MTVVSSMKKINKRIPGFLPPLPKTEVDGKVSDLSTKNIPELLELRDRQLKLLNNKPFISKLHDKGAKIKALYDKIVKEITEKEEQQQTCSMFDKLRISGADKESIQEVEWTGKHDTKKDVYLDSDDDSGPEDVIQILSQSTAKEKTVRILQPDKPLVTLEDLVNIGETPHVKYLVDKSELNNTTKSAGNYKPYRTTTSDVHDPIKEMGRKKCKNWENTAATPPPIIHGPAKLLGLEESLKLQTEYNIHLKEAQAKYAAEKLTARMGTKMTYLPNDVLFGNYREATSDDDSATSDPEGSDKEVYDEEPERGGVIFTVTE